jgi:filamentous hemagglutinin family protein
MKKNTPPRPCPRAAFQSFISRRPRESVSLLVLMSAGLILGSQPAPVQAADTPPRIPVNALPVRASDWQQRGSGATYSVAGSAATVNLKGPANILHWTSLDVGKDASLTFNMASSLARVLNKVDGGAWQNKTVIDGMLKSNGQVYIYNPNGILFGKTATVDVSSLVATSLKVDDQRFMNGILSADSAANFAMDTLLGFVPGAVIVEGDPKSTDPRQQAAITAQANGLIMLVAPEVSNSGQLSAPDGQVVLAAGSKVYLASPLDNNMRGLRVEVDSEGIAALAKALKDDPKTLSASTASAAVPSATNTADGSIAVQRGNITMVGLAVNQMGLASATTSVSLNGSIYLKAQDVAGATKPKDSVAAATRGGWLVLGEGSSTTVLPTLDDTATAATSPAFKSSRIDLLGRSVVLKDDSQVVAPGGQVNITARVNPNEADPLGNASHVEFGQNSLVDVSGSIGTLLSMESNVVKAELRGGELADNPLLKNSAVRGQTVYFDRRKVQAKDMAIANIKGYLSLIEHRVGEYTAAGGKVTVNSEGDIVQKAGSKINVSGGWVDYAGGYLNTSKLVLGGRQYDIETAKADLAYTDAIELGNSSSNWEAGYREGYNAGTVQFNAPKLTLQGQLLGQVTTGVRQRDVSASSRPLGGQLLIGNVNDATMDTTTGRANVGAVDQFGFTGPLVIGAATGAEPAGTLNLDPAALAASGFSRISAITMGDVSVTDPVSLAAGGQLRLGAGGSMVWGANVTMPGGSVTAAAQNGLHVQDGVKFDLAGQWQNDTVAANPERDSSNRPNTSFMTKGGSLRLYAKQLSVGDRVSIDVSGGALLDAAGTLTGGDAGSIALQAATVASSLDASLTLGQYLSLSGYALVDPALKTQPKGGSITLVGRNVVIGSDSTQAQASTAAGDLFLTPEFFNTGGFTTQTVSANGNLSVQAGTQITPRASAWALSQDYALKTARQTQQSMGAVAKHKEWDELSLSGPYGVRQAASLTLRATGRSLPGDGLGQLSIGQGAAIQVDSGASVTLSADQRVTVDGKVQAEGGTISLLLSANAPEDSDNSYDNHRSIWLGKTAQLLANGTADRVYVDGAGVATGEVLDGGTVRLGRLATSGLEAAVGYVVAEQGSVIDVSGAKKDDLRFKYGAYLTDAKTIGSAGGTIDIRAREGLMLAGQLRGAAGTSDARGGTLKVVLDRENHTGGSAFPQGKRQLVLTAAAPSTVVPTGLKAGDAIVGHEGEGVVPVATFADGGFANLKFKSQDVLSFAGAQAGGSGTLALNASSSVELNAPNFSTGADTKVQITAPYVSLGSSDARYQEPAAATDGAGQFKVDATVIDVVGNSATQGIGQVDLTAKEDIRLVGSPSSDAFGAVGSFNTGRQLTLTAAQVYPTTLSSFTLALNGADSTLKFASNGATAQSVLSAAGSLTAKADHIVQAGRVVAPFGSITMDAAKDLSYEAGSVTSVASDTTVPLGTVVNGKDWSYTLNGQTVVWSANPSSNVDLGEQTFPTKQIVSKAPVVLQKAGSVLDAAGGGALMAYEFTPGPGGSGDALQSSGTSSNTTFAINPNYRSSVAPLDWQYGSDGLKVGDQVYLSGGNGLPAGYYTLLPAHYALLAGGYALDVASGTRDMVVQANRVNADGSMTMAGYRTSSTDGRGDTRWSGFTISPQSLIALRSELTKYDATKFFTAQAASQKVQVPVLPSDAGRVAFEVVNRLTLDGVTRLQGAAASATQAAGKRGTADISAPMLSVVANRSAAAGDYVELLADDLTRLGADSLLLGGTRSIDSSGAVHLAVASDVVRVDNSAGHALTSPELILTAKDTVQVTSRAVIKTTGTTDRASGELVVDGSGADADGALLRLSGGAAVGVTRTAPTGTQGRLDVAAGATLAAGASMYLDATGSMRFDGKLNLNPGSAFGVSAPRISLGSTAPADADGLVLNSVTLAELNDLAALSLSSYSTMDWYGTVNLGGATMQQLNLSASGFQSYGTAAAPASVKVNATNIRLNGGSNFALATPAPAQAAGSLSMQAKTISLGSGQLQVRGFGTTALTATKDVRAVGTAGVFTTEQALTITAPVITTDSGAGGSFVAGGALNLVASTANTADVTSLGLGGNLNFRGDTVSSDAQIKALAGQISVQGANGVTLTGGTLDVHGQKVAFGSGYAYAPAGSITLNGGVGNVELGSNAELNLSAQGAAAGVLSVSAVGSADSRAILKGHILGSASAAADVNDGALPTQGSFALDVAQAPTVAEFDALNTSLNSAGLTQSRSVRVRHGDVGLSATGVMQAHDISVAVDDGNLTIAGTLDASGAKGGSVALYAAQAQATGSKGKLTLDSTARINAQATTAATSAAGSIGDGGRVILGVSNADGSAASSTQGGPSIVAQAGAVIDVSGKGVGQGGTVVLRAPRVSTGANDVAGSDVAIGQFAASVTGSRATTVEGVKAYSASRISEQADSATNLNAGLTGKVATEAAAFMGNQSAVLARLGRTDLQLTSGVEVRSSGDLTVSVNEQASKPQDRGWNLNTWRFGGEAGTLSLRAQGNLVIQGSISDGFVASSTAAMPGWQLDTSNKSWSYRLVGGADMQAANPLAVKAGSVGGDVSVQFARAATADETPVALVRTGTGRIDIAAGRDVNFGTTVLRNLDGDTHLDQVFGAAIYTAGYASALADGFTAPSNANNASFGSGNSAASFGTGGGGISINAARDVVGVAAPQLVNNWLFHQGRSGVDSNGNVVFEQVKAVDASTSTLNTAWWARTDYFSQGLATFGGGDVDVAAGGSVRDLSASVATNAYIPGTSPTGAALHEQGGGDLSVRAGADILGGNFYVQKGQAVLHADGAITAGTQEAPDNNAASGYSALRPVLAMGDAAFDASAGRNLEIETVYNPTLARQSLNNVSAAFSQSQGFLAFFDPGRTDDSSLTIKARYAQYGSFSTYGEHSAVRLTSVGGDVLMNNNTSLVAASGGSAQPVSDGYGITFKDYLGYAPATYEVAALTGNVTSGQGFSMAASATGQLSLLAQKSVQFKGNSSIVMLDSDPAAMSTASAPTAATQTDFDLLHGKVIGLTAHTAGGLHADDAVPVRVVAQEGSIQGLPQSTVDVVATLIVPKKAELIAGQDISDLGFTIQHNQDSDITVVQAGGDIVDTTKVASPNAVKHVVAGPGLLYLQAGGNIDLGNGNGVVTRGNLDNAYLPEGGASVMAVAGISATPEYANFISKYATGADTSTTLQARISDYLQQLEQGTLTDGTFDQVLHSIDADTKRTDSDKLQAKNREVQALAQALNQQVQSHGASYLSTRKPLLNALFMTKTRLASVDTGTDPQNPHQPFDDVIASLFPAASITGGNINVFGSQFKTEQGGSLDLLTPGGSVVAGLVSVPAYLASKAASETGIFTVRGGAIRSLVKQDFLVNQGRVFSLGGGDITLISQYGNIDAGRGTKTASSAPPPLLTTDSSGNTKLDISGSISGSGIATLSTSANQEASNVYAVAPRGIFDAGDAGVRSTGAVDIQAAVVLNASNIVAAGAVSGAVSVDAGSIASATPTSTTNNAQEATKQLSAAAKELLGLTVELLGFGDANAASVGNGSADPAETDEERERKKRAKDKAQPSPSR